MNIPDEILPGKKFFEVLLGHLVNAESEILFATFKLVRSTRLGAQALNLCINALCESAIKGVRVKCIAYYPNRPTLLGSQNLKVIRTLQAAGVEFRSRGKFTSLHAKVVIIDSEVIFIGSHNFSSGSCLSNFEISLRTASPPLVQGGRRAYLEAFHTLAPPKWFGALKRKIPLNLTLRWYPGSGAAGAGPGRKVSDED